MGKEYDDIFALVASVRSDAPAVVRTMQDLEAEEAELAEQIKALQAKQKTLKNAREELKKRMADAVEATGMWYIDTDQYKFQLKNNGGVQPLKITGDVPDSFQKIVMEPDKKKIRAALDSGQKLEFAHLEERGKHLVITPKVTEGYDKSLDAKEIIW